MDGIHFEIGECMGGPYESGGHCYTYLGIRSPMRGAYTTDLVMLLVTCQPGLFPGSLSGKRTFCLLYYVY